MPISTIQATKNASAYHTPNLFNHVFFRCKNIHTHIIDVRLLNFTKQNMFEYVQIFTSSGTETIAEKIFFRNENNECYKLVEKCCALASFK